MSAPSATRRRDRRAEILAATCRIIVRDGLDGVRSAAVAAEAGISAGLTHYYYPTLDDLVLAAYLWDQERVWEPFDEDTVAADPFAALEALLGGQLAHPEREVRAAFMFWHEYAQRAIFAPPIRTVVVERVEGWIAALEHLIAASAERGQFADATAARRVGPALSGQLFGASLLHLIGLMPLVTAEADLALGLQRAAAAPARAAEVVRPVPRSPELPMAATSADLILDTTLTTIARAGLRAVHFAEIGAEAGFSIALPRHYFPTLRDLHAATLARFVERRRMRIDGVVEHGVDARERVRLRVIGLGAFGLDDDRAELICWNEFLRRAFVDDQLRPAVCAAVQDELDDVAKALAAAHERTPSAADRDAARQLYELASGVGLGRLIDILDDDRALEVLDAAVADALSATA